MLAALAADAPERPQAKDLTEAERAKRWESYWVSVQTWELTHGDDWSDDGGGLPR